MNSVLTAIHALFAKWNNRRVSTAPTPNQSFERTSRKKPREAAQFRR
jgi:hypothetical protein